MSKPVLVSRTRANQIIRGTRIQRLANLEDAASTMVYEPLVKTLSQRYNAWFSKYFTFRPPKIPQVQIAGGHLDIDDSDDAVRPVMDHSMNTVSMNSAASVMSRFFGSSGDDDTSMPGPPPSSTGPGDASMRSDDDDGDGGGGSSDTDDDGDDEDDEMDTEGGDTEEGDDSDSDDDSDDDDGDEPLAIGDDGLVQMPECAPDEEQDLDPAGMQLTVPPEQTGQGTHRPRKPIDEVLQGKGGHPGIRVPPMSDDPPPRGEGGSSSTRSRGRGATRGRDSDDEEERGRPRSRTRSQQDAPVARTPSPPVVSSVRRDTGGRLSGRKRRERENANPNAGRARARRRREE